MSPGRSHLNRVAKLFERTTIDNVHPLKPRRPSSSLSSSGLPRPYTFHIGASWAAKPVTPRSLIQVPFPPDTPVGSWRDQMLARPKAVQSNSAGEDFFYIQEVHQPHTLYNTRYLRILIDECKKKIDA